MTAPTPAQVAAAREWLDSEGYEQYPDGIWHRDHHLAVDNDGDLEELLAAYRAPLEQAAQTLLETMYLTDEYELVLDNDDALKLKAALTTPATLPNEGAAK